MKALRCESFGPPSNLQLREMAPTTLRPDEVLIEVHAAAVNPSDVKNVMGKMDNTVLPRTPGRDFAGVVVAGPASLMGIAVWGTGGDVGFVRDGSHASHMVLPAAAVAARPKNLPAELAGSSGVTYVTAWMCVCEAAKLRSGETLLVIGATGGVGSAAVQIGKWKGANVIGVVRKESDREAATQSGANHVIVSTEQKLDEAIASITSGKGVNVVVDTVGGNFVETSIDLLAHGGRITEISSPEKERRISFDLIKFYRRRAQLLGVDSRAADVTACASILRDMAPGFESGILRPALEIETYTLEQAIQGYERVLNGQNSGKVVLIPKKG